MQQVEVVPADSLPLIRRGRSTPSLALTDEERESAASPINQEKDDWVWRGDETHPDWQDYLASNLLQALQQVPDTGDWHAALRQWCERHVTGKIPPNPSLIPPAQPEELTEEDKGAIIEELDAFVIPMLDMVGERITERGRRRRDAIKAARSKLGPTKRRKRDG